MVVSAWKLAKYGGWRWHVRKRGESQAYGGFSSKLGLKDRQVREIAEIVGVIVEIFIEINEHDKAKE